MGDATMPGKFGRPEMTSGEWGEKLEELAQLVLKQPQPSSHPPPPKTPRRSRRTITVSHPVITILSLSILVGVGGSLLAACAEFLFP
jgi:hypothetical protein